MNMHRQNHQAGGMLLELMLSIALAAMIIPFVFQYQNRAVVRAQNIAIARNMERIEDALERYIIDNREKLMTTVGRNITRVDLKQLVQYGLDEDSALSDKYQLRIVKSSDVNGRATLQGVVVLAGGDISPMRTREIVSLGGGATGFIEGNHAYGTFGAWRTTAADLGVTAGDAIVGTTMVGGDNALYLWRVPSAATSDATMMSALNLGGHDIIDAKFANAGAMRFDETLTAMEIAAGNVIFQKRTTLDKSYSTKNATCAGVLSADSRTMDVERTFSLADLAKFSSFTTGDLWVSKMTLGGISVVTDDEPAVMRVNRALDMTSGHISAMYVTVGFTGSITPRLAVASRVEDSVNSSFFWDADARVANFADASFPELSRMAGVITRRERGGATKSAQIFGAVSANKNATVGDYMNAINEIQSAVRAKYRMLNLE